MAIGVLKRYKKSELYEVLLWQWH